VSILNQYLELFPSELTNSRRGSDVPKGGESNGFGNLLTNLRERRGGAAPTVGKI
jgi:hypothetical protein